MPRYRTKAPKRRRKGPNLKKAPGAPKRFKSSYIHFFMHVHDSVKKSLPAEEATAPQVSKRASEIWKSLPASDRKYWDDLAVNEKKLYLEQKGVYKGPWKVLKKRTKKDPSAPKRNPSAFLLYASTRRPILQDKNPHLDNTSISRILGHEWRIMDPDIKNRYVQRELAERASYKEQMVQWKREKELEAQKVNRQDLEIPSQRIPSTEIRDPFEQKETQDFDHQGLIKDPFRKNEEVERDEDTNIHVDALLRKLFPEKEASRNKEAPVTRNTPPLATHQSSNEVKKDGMIAPSHSDLDPRTRKMRPNPLDFLMDVCRPQTSSASFKHSPLSFYNVNNPTASLNVSEETLPCRRQDTRSIELDPYHDLESQEIHPIPLSALKLDSSFYPFHPYGLEGGFRRMEKTSKFYEGSMFNEEVDLCGGLSARPREICSSRRLGALASPCENPSRGSEFFENKSPGRDSISIGVEGSFNRLYESQSITDRENECNRFFGVYRDLWRNEIPSKAFDKETTTFDSLTESLYPSQLSELILHKSTASSDENDCLGELFSKLEERILEDAHDNDFTKCAARNEIEENTNTKTQYEDEIVNNNSKKNNLLEDVSGLWTMEELDRLKKSHQEGGMDNY